MTVLAIGLILFLGVHCVPMIQNLRSGLINSLGAGAYKGLYSLIAAIGLGLIIWGYGLARENPVIIFDTIEGLHHLTLLLMIPVFIFLISAYLPGKIGKILKHPMLIAVKTWALAHILVNGTLADLALFGGFLVWAVLSVISNKRRDRQAEPKEEKPTSAIYDLIAVTAGLGLYVGFAFWAHEYLIGMSPI